MAKKGNPDSSRTETWLAYTAVTLIAVSLITLFAVLIAGAFGARVLPVFLVWIPELGLPASLLLIIALILLSSKNRKKND